LLEDNLVKQVLLPASQDYIIETIQQTGFNARFDFIPHNYSALIKQIKSYYSGHIVKTWSAAFDLSYLPSFTRNVLNLVSHIPYGKTTSYSEIAYTLGKPRAARAVGQVMKKNPLPLIIPCHRVLAKNGWGGFSGPGGIHSKKNDGGYGTKKSKTP